MSISSNFLGKERDQAFSPQAKRWSRVREQREFCQLHLGGENKVVLLSLRHPRAHQPLAPGGLASPRQEFPGAPKIGVSRLSLRFVWPGALPQGTAQRRWVCCLRGISLKSRRKPADLTPSFTSYQRTCKLTLFRATLNFRQGERKNKNQQTKEDGLFTCIQADKATSGPPRPDSGHSITADMGS